MVTNKKKSTSWTLIIVLLLFFPLIGIILLIKKLYEDKAGAYQNSLVARILGGIGLGFGILVFLMFLLAEPTASNIIVIIIAFICPGLLLFLKGASLKKDAVRYEKYLDLIWQKGLYSINDIAAEVSLTYAKTSKELQALINAGYIENVYLDQGRQMVVVNGYEPNILSQPKQSNPSAVDKTKQNTTKVVVCKNCGANTAVTYGTTTECEYCGSPVSYT